jgi:GntR family transcriptional regulator
MISVKVDKADPTDLYEQVAAEIRRAIADGEAKSGERLPAAVDLAAILGVNKNTVLRAPCKSFGTKGFSSSVAVEALRSRGLLSVVPSVQRARELVEFARRQGYGLDDLHELIDTVG